MIGCGCGQDVAMSQLSFLLTTGFRKLTSTGSEAKDLKKVLKTYYYGFGTQLTITSRPSFPNNDLFAAFISDTFSSA